MQDLAIAKTLSWRTTRFQPIWGIGRGLGDDAAKTGVAAKPPLWLRVTAVRG